MPPYTGPELDRSLRCPKCDQAAVELLPPNAISSEPVYRCRACQSKLRGPNSLLINFVILLIGLVFFVGLTIVIFVRPDDPHAVKFGKFGFIGLIVAAYAVVQLMRPVVRRVPVD